MEYEVFTTNLKNLKGIKVSIEKLKTKLEVKEYEETGVKGIDYTRTTCRHNPSLTALKRLEMVDEVDELTRELNCLLLMAEEIESLLDRMPEELKGMLTEKFIKGWTYERVGEKYGYSHSGIQYRMRVETEKYL